MTAALMDVVRERGCTEAILHASELGRPVYERLGFVEVYQVPQFVWLPPEAATAVVEAVEEATTVLRPERCVRTGCPAQKQSWRTAQVREQPSCERSGA